VVTWFLVLLRIEKPNGKDATRRPRHRRLDHIKMNFNEIRWESVYYIYVTQNRDNERSFVNMGKNFAVPREGKFLVADL
jgi:hypothetical protein